MRQVKGVYFLVFAIFLIAFLLRVIPLEYYHGWDETSYLQHAEHIAFGKSNYAEGFRPPLLPVLIAGGFKFRHHPFVASFIVALLSASITIAMFFLGRKLHSDTAGIFAAILVALHPALVTFGHLLLTDAIVASFCAFALLFALNTRWQLLLVSGIFAALGALTKFTGLGVVPVLFLYILYRDWKEGFENVFAYVAGFSLIFIPYLFFAHTQGGFLAIMNQAHVIVNYVHGGPLYYLHIELFTISLLLGIGLLVWQWRTTKISTSFLLLAIAWAVVILGYLSTFPNKEVRYGLLAIVPIFVLAGIGYAAATHRIKWKYITTVFILLIAIFSLGAFSRTMEPTLNYWKSPTVLMAEKINSLNTTAPLYVTSDYPIYGYYTNNPIVVVDGPMFLEAYPLLMGNSGYMVVYKSSTKPPTVNWTDQNPKFKRITENEISVLYEYTVT